jgi:lysozyme
MGFNLGFKGFMSFKNLIKALKNNDYELAVVEMLNSKWANQVKNRAVRLAKMMETGHWPTDIY